MHTKNCLNCSKEFKKPSYETYNSFGLRKYCSLVCSRIGSKGILRDNSGTFKKGVEPWNKGKIGYMSEQGRRNISKSAKNNIYKETPEQRRNRMVKMQATMKERGSHGKPRLGKTGDKDPNWKGEEASYNSKHKWIQKHWIKTEYCEICKKYTPAPPNTRLKFGTQWANISNEYKRIREDWLELCPKCHRNYDRNK